MSAAKDDRVRMAGQMQDDPDPIPVGEEGTVLAVLNGGSALEQLVVAWDSGRSLMLLPGDPYEVVGRAASG